MRLGGFTGRTLFVDLSDSRAWIQPLDPCMAEEFLGGFGLNVRLAWDHITPGTDALDPKNRIILGAGPMVGTNVPASSRVYAVCKFPASGTVGWCGAGGMTFGCMLKASGLDHIVITGRAESPVYLEIFDDKVEIRDARNLWGQGVEATCMALWGERGWPAGIISIGQAGENLVRFAMAYVDRFSTLGRGGFGAVMGSKNLKAIMVRGTKGVRVTDKRLYSSLTQELLERIRQYPYLKEWQELGLMKSLPVAPVEVYLEMKKRRVACVSCPVGDKDLLEIQHGPMKGMVVCSTSAANLYTPMIYGFRDHAEAVRCVAVLDELGMDMFEFFGVMGFAKALVQNGVIQPGNSDPSIELDSLVSMEAWAHRIAGREGLGSVLADGLEGVLKEFGERARPFAPYMVKGMLPYVGPAAPLKWSLLGTMELGQVLDPRGPHVAASGSPTYFQRRPLEVFPRHLDRMGVPREAVQRILPGLGTEEAQIDIGRLLKYSHMWFTILASLGICARAQINRFYSAEICARLYEAVTGIETTLEDLRVRADRVWNLLRMINVREGFNRVQESPPEAWFKEPGFKDYLRERPLSRLKVDQMIESYYLEQGWDPDTGLPTRERLRELGLLELVSK
jgi:aldehyde:ferredoxin oxidoreductase